jgi:hypothetical protein
MESEKMAPSPQLDVRELDLEALPDSELQALVILATAEQHRRAVTTGDPTALTENGFASGFGVAPKVQDPWVVEGILVAPGGRFDRGASAHRCSFVKVGGHWVWEHPAKISDEIRRGAAKDGMRSVTLVAMTEGDRIDLVSSRSRNGAHNMTSVRSFEFRDGSLTLIDVRGVVSDLNHR